MLIFDYKVIGNKLYTFRKRFGMTQAELADSAGLSDRTYADIERGTVNMRLETMLRICNVLKITPNDILVEESDFTGKGELEMVILHRLNSCSAKEKETACNILQAYLSSLL